MSLNEHLETEIKCDIQAEGEREAKKPGNISESSGTEAMILVVQFQKMTNQRSIHTWYLPADSHSKVHREQQSNH